MVDSRGPISEEDANQIRALIERSQLAAIEVHELSAKRYEEPDSELRENDARIEVSVQYRRDDESFGVRLVCDAHLQHGEARAAVSGEYQLEPDTGVSDREVQLFGNEVAIMTVFPYLRQAMSDITTRVFGRPLTLPIAERGQIAFEVPPSQS